MKLKSVHYIMGMAVAAMLTVTGCGKTSGSIDDIDAFDPAQIAENLEAYTLKDCKDAEDPSKNKNVYIDFSDGMYNVFQYGDNQKMIQNVTNRLTNEVKWFQLANSKIEPLEGTSTQIFNKVTDKNAYLKASMAPIEEALKVITNSSEEALLITDFEEYVPDKDGKGKAREQFENFAKDEFSEWLKKGNTIDFYITDYVEKGNSKHLYFIVFSTPAGELKGLVEKAFEGKNFNYKTYTMATNNFAMSTEYPSEKQGGNFYDEKGVDNIFIMDQAKGFKYKNACDKGYEFYPSAQPWEDIHANAVAYMEEGTPKQFTHLMRNLFINMKAVTAYKIDKLDVRVSDVTEDFEFFVKTREVAKNKPKMTTDGSGNKVVDEENNNPIALECYNADGSLKKEWKYEPKAIKELREVLALDTKLYENSMKENAEKTEIGIVFHPNYNDNEALRNARLVRVDVVIAECTPNYDNLDELFSWESITVKGRTNDALAQSIRNALQDVNPKGKAIYSYYIYTM